MIRVYAFSRWLDIPLTVVLNNDVRRAEVEEPSNDVVTLEEMLQHFDKLLLSFLSVDKVLVLLDDLEAFLEWLLSVLQAHVTCELWEFASVQVDHFLIVLLAQHAWNITRAGELAITVAT